VQAPTECFLLQRRFADNDAVLPNGFVIADQSALEITHHLCVHRIVERRDIDAQPDQCLRQFERIVHREAQRFEQVARARHRTLGFGFGPTDRIREAAGPCVRAAGKVGEDDVELAADLFRCRRQPQQLPDAAREHPCAEERSQRNRCRLESTVQAPDRPLRSRRRACHLIDGPVKLSRPLLCLTRVNAQRQCCISHR